MAFASYVGDKANKSHSPDSLISWGHPARRSTTHGLHSAGREETENQTNLSTALSNNCAANMSPAKKSSKTHKNKQTMQ
jgi:hypothetical protein